MLSKPPPPGAFQIIRQDAVTVLAVLALLPLIAVFIAAILLLQETLPQDNLNVLMMLFIGLMVAYLGLIVGRLLRRIRRIRNTWQRGTISKALVLQIRDAGLLRFQQRRVLCAFVHDGKTYNQSVLVGPDWSPYMRQVNILIDPVYPQRSILLIKYQ